MPAAEAEDQFQFLDDLMQQRLAGAGRVAIAVSGGSDSTALMHLCRGFDAVVLTVDHGLRRESADEAVLVELWAKDLGFEHRVLSWSGEKPARGIQAAARKARYELMTQWCREHGIGVLLTAHTADDQAETVVMRRMRSASARSIAGIWPETKWNHIRVLRPLLDVRREVLRGFLRAIGVKWIDDPSNDNPAFERVRVRRSLVSGEVGGLVNMAAAAQSHVLANVEAAQDWMNRHVLKSQLGYLEIGRSALISLSADEQAEMLAEAIQLVSGLPVSPAETARLSAWMTGTAPGRRTLGGCLFSKRLRAVLVVREWRRINKSTTLVPEQGRVVWDERYMITAPPGSAVTAAGFSGSRKSQNDLPMSILGGLPSVALPGGKPVLPQFAQDIGIGCEFLRF